MDFDGELDAEASAMAAAMGFSSFGSHKPPAAKRKFNAATDAFISGQELEKIDRGGKSGKGSGGNTMPLGKMRQFGTPSQSTKANEDQTDVIGDEPVVEFQNDHRSPKRRALALPDPIGESHPSSKRQKTEPSGDYIPNQNHASLYEATNKRKDVENSPRSLDKRRKIGDPHLESIHGQPNLTKINEDAIDLDDEDVIEPWGHAIDTSKAPPAKVIPLPERIAAREALEVQYRIDALLKRVRATEPPAEDTTAQPDDPTPQPEPEPVILPPPPPGLPSRPAVAAWHNTGQKRGGSRGGRGNHQGREAYSDTASVASSRPSHGERNAKWYVDYYDPSFNENPWKALEQKMNIESQGTWLARADRVRDWDDGHGRR